MSEIDDLREENARLRRDLELADQENAILRKVPTGLGASKSARSVVRVEVDNERVRFLENAVTQLEMVAKDISSDDCHDSYNTTSGKPCACNPCWASRILEEVHAWRYGGSVETPTNRHAGAMVDRLTSGHHPREVKMHRAWCKEVDDDYTLGRILSERPKHPGTVFETQPDPVSARDWYVATTVVQWLATNVGMSILEAADFRYTKFDEDRAEDRAEWEARERHPSVIP